jgi:hypothetical protein
MLTPNPALTILFDESVGRRDGLTTILRPDVATSGEASVDRRRFIVTSSELPGNLAIDPLRSVNLHQLFR